MRKVRNRKGFTVIELLIVMAVIGILFAIVFGSCSSGFTMGKGDQVGVVVKFSKVGIVCKTWEGEMLLGGQGAVTKGAWSFSVDEDDVAIVKAIEQALNSQRTVKLSYVQNLLPRPWLGSTTSFIKGVNFIE